MATVEQRSEKRRPVEVAEALIAPDTPMRVYPMGFTPEIKKQLLDSVEARNLRSARFSELGKTLREAMEAFREGAMGLDALFDVAAQLDDAVKDGEHATRGERDFIQHALRTEEELAVIFARVSRSPGSFEENARSVTEEGAAQFHQKWVVSIEGYGHASVAEHAIIHMAVENVPSLDGDWVTDNRLAAFTEFSARFKGRQDVGYYTPESVARDPILAAHWHEVHQRLFALNDELMRKGTAYIATDEARLKWPNRRVTTKTVADQFKDLMPASRLTSIGVTLNTREAENVIRKFLSSPYPSVQTLGALLKEQSLRVAPTLVKYADRNEYMVAARRGIGQLADEQRFQGYVPEVRENGKLVDLIEVDPRADAKFIAAALFADCRTGTFRELLETAERMSLDEKRAVIEKLLEGLGGHDVPIRALEMSGDFIVEFPGMTYGTWREYKRHRIQSYWIKDFNTQWGYMVPPLAYEMDESRDSQFHGAVEAIKQAMGEVEDLFSAVYRVDPYAAHYAVTRLHYRPAVAKFNPREAFHLIDLRTGPTAHPFIRRLMWPLLDQIRPVQPIIYDHLRLKMHTRTRPLRNFPWTF